MRMRRKKHLDERLLNVKEYLAVVNNEFTNVKEALKNPAYIDTQDLFGNFNKTELEIGCGKGGFISKFAKLNENVNFIAVEMIQNIIVSACEEAQKLNLKNVKFINSGAEYLPRYLKPDSIDNIYLNFSPPFPKKSNENKRLTSKRFLEEYNMFLKKGGKIYQRTDDKEFLEYSKQSFSDSGYSVEDTTGKLPQDRIMTEYEKKFIEQGFQVFSLTATKTF